MFESTSITINIGLALDSPPKYVTLRVATTHSLILRNKTPTTLLLLFTAVTACCASSLTVTKPAPNTTPPPRTANLRLPFLFPADFALFAAFILVAKLFRGGVKGAWCLVQARQVHGVVRRRIGENTPREFMMLAF
jgi:hypothetical protein